MLVVSGGVGAVGGGIGAVYLAALHVLQQYLWPDRHSPLAHLFVMAAVGGVVAGIVRLLGSAGDMGEYLAEVHDHGGPREQGFLRSLIPVSLLCVSSGAGMGPEAPLVQTTGSLGTWLGRRWGYDQRDTRVLAIGGMAAGFTVLFGVTLGSALFAAEFVQRRGLRYAESLLCAVAAASAAWASHQLITGEALQPVWQLAAPDPAPGPVAFVRGVGLGLLGGAVGMGFILVANQIKALCARLPKGVPYVAGGVALGLLGLWSPYALTYGELQVNELSAAHWTAAALVTAALAKFLGAAVTFGSGWKGGYIIPMFFVGAALGTALAGVPAIGGGTATVLAMMAAVNTASTKTPLGSALVVSAMAGLMISPTVVLAALVALAVSDGLAMFSGQRHS